MIPQPPQDIIAKFNAVVKALNDVKTSKKATLANIAALTGLSKTQAGELLNGKFTRPKDGLRNFSDAVVERLYRDFVANDKPVETAAFLNLIEIAQNTQKSTSLTCVVGKTGLGKSTAIKHLLRAQSNVFYILCSHLTDGTMLFEQVAQCFSIEATWENLKGKKRKLAVLEAIAEFANKRAEPVLLALDDFHHVANVKICQDLKWLHDVTERALGLLLIGTHNLEESLKKWAGYDLNWNARYKPKNIMPEFVRRFNEDFQRLPDISEDDLKLICRAKGVTDVRIWKTWAKKPNLDLGAFCGKLDTALEAEGDPKSPAIFSLMS